MDATREHVAPQLASMRRRFSRLCRSGRYCCSRLARPAAVFISFVAMLSLAYFAGLSRCGSRTDITMVRDKLTRRTASLHAVEHIVDLGKGDTTNAGTRLSVSVPTNERRSMSLINDSYALFPFADTAVNLQSLEPRLSQSESARSSNMPRSNNTRNARFSDCDASALPRWQVDYALRAGVQCDLLIAGDRSESLKAETFLNDSRDTLSCSLADTILAAASCDDLRAAGYGKLIDSRCLQNPSYNAGDDNDSSTFRLAFGIRLHRCAVQAELLLRSIYAPQHLYCLHVDGRAGADVLASVSLLASCLPNVLLAPPDYDFVYGSVSQLHADLTCMRILLDHDNSVSGYESYSSGTDSAVRSKWSYFLNVAGQELPLRTNAELVSLMRAYNGSNDVASQFNPNIRWRYASKLYCKNPNGTTERCSRADTVAKNPPPGNVTIYKGVSYGFFSRSLVEYVLRPGGFAAQLYDWIADTWAPDEQYFATLVRQPDAPGGYRQYGRTSHPTARAVKWSGYRYDSCHGVLVRGVCVLGVGDLPWLARQSEAFANKFDYERDPLAVQCLIRYTNNFSRPLKPNFY